MKLNIYPLLVLNYLLIITYSKAQAPLWEWAKLGGGISRAITSDKSDNIYVVGSFTLSFTIFGNDTLHNANSTGKIPNIYIAKYSSMGDVLWAKSVSGTGEAEAYSVATDAVGNVYVEGEFRFGTMIIGSDTLKTLEDYGTDLFLIKFNPQGKVIWARTAGGGHCYTNTRSISADKDGNVYMCGFFQSNSIKFDSITLYNCVQSPQCSIDQYNDLFIAKFDSSGKVKWAKSAGGIDFDYAWSVYCDNSGFVYMCGVFYDKTITFDSITLYKSGGLNNIFLVKYDTDGNVLWAKSKGSKNEDAALAVTSDASGCVYVAGSFNGNTLVFASDTLKDAWQGNFFILKYDKAGNELWARAAVKNSTAKASTIITDTSNNVYLAGEFLGKPFALDSTDIPNNGKSEIFLAKYSKNGKYLWVKIITGNQGNNGSKPESIIIDTSDNLYMTGAACYSNFDTISIGKIKGCGFLAKLSTNPLVNTTLNKDNSTLNLYPNPNEGSFFVDLPATGKIIAEVYNILGEKTHAEQLYISKSNTTLKLNIPSPHHGIYFVKLVTQHDVYTKKVYIQ